MPIGDICIQEVFVASRDTTIQDAALLMRQKHVGDVIIVDNAKDARPVGIVTDRDIVISVVAMKLDPEVFTLGDLTSRPLVTAREDQGVFETIQQMRKNAIRRMPIVDREGKIVGIVAVDDLVQLLAEELAELGKLISREQAREAVTKR